jgi:hypothetical protein
MLRNEARKGRIAGTMTGRVLRFRKLWEEK